MGAPRRMDDHNSWLIEAPLYASLNDALTDDPGALTWEANFVII
jgi:hypothetical protein